MSVLVLSIQNPIKIVLHMFRRQQLTLNLFLFLKKTHLCFSLQTRVFLQVMGQYTFTYGLFLDFAMLVQYFRVLAASYYVEHYVGHIEPI